MDKILVDCNNEDCMERLDYKERWVPESWEHLLALVNLSCMEGNLIVRGIENLKSKDQLSGVKKDLVPPIDIRIVHFSNEANKNGFTITFVE